MQENLRIFDKYPHILTGIFEDAERKILIVGEEDLDEYLEEKYVTIFEITSREDLEHRKILGSILGLGLKREVIGDIIIDQNVANIVVLKEIKKYILQNFDRVGREKITIKEIRKNEILKVKPKCTEFNTTVASLRLDAVISACFGTSREISCKLIEAEKVNMNYLLVTNSSKQIKQGDLISVRGFGRFEVQEIIGETRKGRIRINIKKYEN